MLRELNRLCNQGGRLLKANCTLFDGNRSFVTAIGLEFEYLTIVFRVVPDDDTLAVSLGELIVPPDETIVDLANVAPWPECIGQEVCWAWRLTNQQGYTDGTRLEFDRPGESSQSVILELVTVASALKIFRGFEG